MEVTFTLQFGKASVEILCGQCLPPAQLGITAPHCHRLGEVHILLSGEADYTIGEKSLVLQTGDAVHIPAKTFHSAICRSPETTFLAFSLRNGPREFAFSRLSPALLTGLYQASVDSGQKGSLNPLMPYFYILMEQLLHMNGPTIRESLDYEGMIQRYLDANYAKNLTLSSLAQAVGLSPRQVQRIIQKETGNTYLEEVTNRRMNAARYLEENTSMTSAEIAHYVGYNSYSGYWKARKQYLQREQE